ncbi:DUF349 domain-containing protein [Gillisia sp. M10.2A]|uniref:DUF349 domain-containing protein n=1 Tax=Gillisia lutea TaxID=2909668 RepID=A0ABS9EEQ8_9FLAO|nr:DUF349 domain-containing protein [Gillisia lutea]MCF4101342.1 DUF349 domain-containing protein [Gillisia lutea]
MSQQENDHMKNDLPQEDLKNSEANSTESSAKSDKPQEEQQENKSESSFSKLAETSTNHPDSEKEKDNLEKAMVAESEASGKSAETEQRESDSTSSHMDEEEEKAESITPSKKSAQSEFEDSVAEDSEDETVTERHGIEKKDYHSMSKEELVGELEKLVGSEKVQAIKEHVEEIRSEFNAKFDEELEEKKEEFLADGGNIIDFHYSTPIKKQFNSAYFDYKEKRNNYYQQLKQDLNKNLDKRLAIIEELKGLLDVEENINTTYKHFKDLQDRWRTAGPIPRDKYNTVWNTYHHHVENFYDFLHLNREFRDLDFKHNLEQKLKVIDRAEELTLETDTNRAFRELQMLHKMWKEELGPVAKEYRDDIWDRFSEATKKIHDMRQAYYDDLDKQHEVNLVVKQEIIAKIKAIADGSYKSHSQWQQKIKELEALREQFFKAGKVPREKNEATWSEFKQHVRQFNRNKNAYYKSLKKEQYDNLEKKRELIQIAEDNKENEDFKATTPLMKKIQADWKKVGHVPRKDSDKVWKLFKAACNHYFDRLHKASNQENAEETKAFDQKKEILDRLKSMELSGEKKTDLPKIKAVIEEWKNIGKVPYNKRFIEGKFNKVLDQLFSKLDVDHTKAEMMKYENKIQALNDADDDKKLRNEHYFLTKKVEETKNEIRQLENNLQFFSNVDEDNPLVKEVHKNIQDHKDQLEVWKEKLEKIKSIY